MRRYSLSWFKKRTAALNKALGTKYSPKELYKYQDRSVVARMLEEAGDPRSKKYKPPVKEFIDLRWSNFISNTNVGKNLDKAFSSGGFISAGGDRVYVQENGTWMSYNVRGGAGRSIKTLPKDAQPLNGKRMEQELRKVAERLKKFKSDHPLTDYTRVNV